MTKDTRTEELNECPLADTHDRFAEAHYFIERMLIEYHEPLFFRANLNAFLQALRNVTFVLQSEFSTRDGFKEEWYPARQEAMRSDPLLCNFVEGRNIVVKRGNLLIHSKAEVGLFRGRALKGGFATGVSADVPSEYLLKHVAPKLGGVAPGHPFIGEQYGVRREWYASELGEEKVITLCNLAWVKIGQVLSEAHTFAGWHNEPPAEHRHKDRVESCEVLLETDLDPSLIEKWGWD